MAAVPRKCPGTKKDGNPCQYRAKHLDPISKTFFCKHHLPKISSTTTIITQAKSRQPPYQKDRLRSSVVKKIERRLKSGPRTTDEPGHIYVYALQHEMDAQMDYWKVGMTTRAPEERAKEWSAKHHKTHTVVTQAVFHVPTRAVKHVERLIHLYLDYCRLYRYPLASGAIRSVWAHSGNLIEDKDGKEWAAQTPQERPVALHKMVEWFWISWKDLEPLIKELIAFYCGR